MSVCSFHHAQFIFCILNEWAALLYFKITWNLHHGVSVEEMESPPFCPLKVPVNIANIRCSIFYSEQLKCHVEVHVGDPFILCVVSGGIQHISNTSSFGKPWLWPRGRWPHLGGIMAPPADSLWIFSSIPWVTRISTNYCQEVYWSKICSPSKC